MDSQPFKFLSVEFVHLPKSLRITTALLVLFVIPCTQPWIKHLRLKPITRLILGPAGRVFLVDFLLRPASISFHRIITACVVLPTVIVVVTSLNYCIYHRKVLQFIKSLEYTDKLEFSTPRSVVQQLCTNATMAFICQQLAYSNVSMARVIIFGVLSLSLERIYYQWLLFNNCCQKEEYRVFLSSKSSSADGAHWYVQVEMNRFDIFKVGHSIGNTVGPRSSRRGIPSSLSEALYVPFFQYGIAGICHHPGDKQNDLVKEVYQGMKDEYSSSYQSCQEFAVLSLCLLCNDPLYNMSDSKSLCSIILVIFIYYLFSSSDLLLLESYRIWKLVVEDFMI